MDKDRRGPGMKVRKRGPAASKAAYPFSFVLPCLVIGLWPLFPLIAQAQTTPLDASRYLREQDGKLGAAAGTIVLREPAQLEGDVTLGVGHALLIDAPLAVSKGSIHLAGQNEIRCNAPITILNATDLFVADGASDLSVRDCDVSVMAKPGGGYLLTATRSTRVAATDNHLVRMAIFNTHNTGGAASQTTDVMLANNSTAFAPGTGPIGIYLLYVIRGVVANNRLEGTGHGIQWWGGDANAGWQSAAEVNASGDLSITGNLCYNAGGSCVWGSMGFDVNVSGNTADSCSDVCFDTEGGVRNIFTANVARDCANGCYSAQFESVDTTFSGNYGYAEGNKPAALVLIKHPAGRGPNHVNLAITGNTFSCAQVCAALYTEGEDGLLFADNNVTNGITVFVNYTNSVIIRGNTLRFTASLGGVPAIGGPAITNGHHSEIADNIVLNEAQASRDAACIVQAWSDNNNSDEMSIVRNSCVGLPHGIITETAGHNAGAPHAVWFLEGNQFSGVPEAQQIVHRHTSGNELYTSVPAGSGAK